MHFRMSSAVSFNLDRSKNFSSGNGFICINSLPDDKILDWSKLKAIADDKINVTQKLKFVLRREENLASVLISELEYFF